MIPNPRGLPNNLNRDAHSADESSSFGYVFNAVMDCQRESALLVDVVQHRRGQFEAMISGHGP